MASCFQYLFCLLLVHLPFFTSAQSSYRNITLGSSLSNLDRNPYWTSPSGDFAFGFHLQNDVFLLAIWFDKIPVKTIVWTANDGKPVERGAKIELTSNGVLSLTAQNGTELWKNQVADNSQVDHAAMLNTGNLVLTSTESTTVWESFDNPTDTMVPTQILEFGRRLSSRQFEDDYTIGKFQLSMQSDGNLVLYTMARPPEDNYGAYWASNTVGNGSQLVFNQSGYIYLTLKSGSNYFLPFPTQIPDSTQVYYQRVTLDYDGVLRQYTYPKASPSNGKWPKSWSASWSFPGNICTQLFSEYGSGVCGFNSYCRIDQDQRAQCECPPGYSYLDPNNTFKGCKPHFVQQSCETNGSRTTDGFEMREILSTNWPDFNYERFKSVSEDWCGETCLNDCFCAAALTNAGNCWLKKFPLSRGFMNPGTSGKALIKVGNSSVDHVSSTTIVEKKDDKNWILPGSIAFGISVILNLLLVVMAIYLARNKNEIKTQTDNRSTGVNLRPFTYKELEEATDDFKEELGKGAFSTVYKGVLKADTGCLVAVKRLDRLVERNDREFKAEMNAIGKTNHKNLVQLLGFCDEEAHRLLVYEFMRNGSLESFLFGSSKLKWNQRIQIAFGIARGLAYLHEDCSSPIIHCDVKPQNILLDDSYVARISDFGLAKLLKSDQTRTMTGIRGTRGYVAPEWFKHMAITAKVDVYSFGVMLLEIVCCRKNAVDVGDEDIEILSDWAYECCEQKALHLLVGNDEEAKSDGKTLEKLVMVSLWCIQEEPSLRPSMKKVTQMLEGAAAVSMPPDPSSFISSIG